MNSTTRGDFWCGRSFGAIVMTLALAACSGTNESEQNVATFDGIAADESITALGTEPFWNAVIADGTLVYTTPEQMDGQAIPVTRFAGNGGLGISGVLDDQQLDLAITPGECSDGMSDRVFPYVATLAIGDQVRSGCAYTDQQPFSGAAAP